MLYEPEQGGSSDEEMLEDSKSDRVRIIAAAEPATRTANRFSRKHWASAAKSTVRSVNRGEASQAPVKEAPRFTGEQVGGDGLRPVESYGAERAPAPGGGTLQKKELSIA
jgi:hypothetical protein